MHFVFPFYSLFTHILSHHFLFPQTHLPTVICPKRLIEVDPPIKRISARAGCKGLKVTVNVEAAHDCGKSSQKVEANCKDLTPIRRGVIERKPGIK
jgi:hypothetical protein